MRESIRKDRARIQVGKISNFGLLEMTRQRLREGSIKWETNLSLDSFSLKLIKKIEMLAFTNKIKSINAYVPEKVKIYIDSLLNKEIDYFQKKYSYKIEIMAKPDFIVPEYKIELLNKNNRIVNVIENINKIQNLNLEEKKVKKKDMKKDIKKDVKKTIQLTKNEKIKVKKKKTKTARTLWSRRKKAS